MDQYSRLNEIEEELATEVKADQRNWTRIYQLMHEVEAEKLYAGTHASFTAWVNAQAAKMQVHVSLLWARLKAGRVYAEYAERAGQSCREVPNLNQIEVSPDSINLCATIAGKNAAVMDSLMDQVVAGTLSRSDLRRAAVAKRAAGAEVAKTRHDRITAVERNEASLENPEKSIDAAFIVLALKNPEWIPIVNDDKHFIHCYHTFTEFRAPSGTSSHTRRFDLMLAETRSEQYKDHITLRGIEIKVSKSDLLNDTKMAEYTDFCDFFYIAVPDKSEMISAAESVMLETWGLITISDSGDISVLHEPSRLPAVFRDKSLTNAILRMRL